MVVGIEEFHAVPGPLVDVVLQEREAPVGEVQADIFVPMLTGNKERKTEVWGDTYGVHRDKKRRGEGVRDGMEGRAEAGLGGQPLGGWVRGAACNVVPRHMLSLYLSLSLSLSPLVLELCAGL